ncbi:MAG TPA: hypothetical protein VE198_06290, partial [Actinoallomurus sp.]|nr:hypothetical protein [Actinoallomurus sp.]
DARTPDTEGHLDCTGQRRGTGQSLTFIESECGGPSGVFPALLCELRIVLVEGIRTRLHESAQIERAIGQPDPVLVHQQIAQQTEAANPPLSACWPLSHMRRPRPGTPGTGPSLSYGHGVGVDQIPRP